MTLIYLAENDLAFVSSIVQLVIDISLFTEIAALLFKSFDISTSSVKYNIRVYSLRLSPMYSKVPLGGIVSVQCPPSH